MESSLISKLGRTLVNWPSTTLRQERAAPSFRKLFRQGEILLDGLVIA